MVKMGSTGCGETFASFCFPISQHEEWLLQPVFLESHTGLLTHLLSGLPGSAIMKTKTGHHITAHVLCLDFCCSEFLGFIPCLEPCSAVRETLSKSAVNLYKVSVCMPSEETVK